MNPQRVCIVGAGAVGGTIGARLAAAGHATSALARGATLEALRRDGWRLHIDDAEVRAPAEAESDAARLGPHEIVVIAVKGHALPTLAPTLTPLIGPDTTIVSALNGIPWWFFAGLGGRAGGLRLPAVDPEGRIAAALPPQRTVACIVQFACSTPQPGVARLDAGNTMVVGPAVAGPGAERAAHVGTLMGSLGFDVEPTDAIHRAVWHKLLGNLTMNPISAVTGATTDAILDDELVVDFIRSVMREAVAVGDAIGCRVDQDPDSRLATTRARGGMRTSMLQDADAGRAIELDPLVAAVSQLARRLAIPTPSIDTLLGLTRLWARTHGLLADDPSGPQATISAV